MPNPLRGNPTGRPQVGVCTACGKILEFAGHVNLDLDLRLHRETDGCEGTRVAYRRATKRDLEEFERGVPG